MIMTWMMDIGVTQQEAGCGMWGLLSVVVQDRLQSYHRSSHLQIRHLAGWQLAACHHPDK